MRYELYVDRTPSILEVCIMKLNDVVKRRVAHNVRGFRELMGVSQEKLAEYADLHRTYIGFVERGERNITLYNLFKIAKGLKIKPHVLLIEDAYKLSAEELKKALFP